MQFALIGFMIHGSNGVAIHTQEVGPFCSPSVCVQEADKIKRSFEAHGYNVTIAFYTRDQPEYVIAGHLGA
jgi:hypothetical protein